MRKLIVLIVAFAIMTGCKLDIYQIRDGKRKEKFIPEVFNNNNGLVSFVKETFCFGCWFGFKFFFVLTKRPSEDRYSKIAVAYNVEHKVDIYDAEDNQMNAKTVSKILPQNILDVLNKHIGAEVFVNLPPKLFIDGLPNTIRNSANIESFLLSSTNKEIISALQKVADESMAYTPGTLLEFRDLINGILKRAKASMYDSAFQDEIYRIMNNEPDKGFLNLPGWQVSSLLEWIMNKKLNAPVELLTPFIWAPGMIKKIMDSSDNPDDFENNLVEVLGKTDLYEDTLRYIGKQYISDNQNYSTQKLWKVVQQFIASGYNFKNLVLNKSV